MPASLPLQASKQKILWVRTLSPLPGGSTRPAQHQQTDTVWRTTNICEEPSKSASDSTSRRKKYFLLIPDKFELRRLPFSAVSSRRLEINISRAISQEKANSMTTVRSSCPKCAYMIGTRDATAQSQTGLHARRPTLFRDAWVTAASGRPVGLVLVLVTELLLFAFMVYILVSTSFHSRAASYTV